MYLLTLILFSMNISINVDDGPALLETRRFSLSFNIGPLSRFSPFDISAAFEYICLRLFSILNQINPTEFPNYVKMPSMNPIPSSFPKMYNFHTVNQQKAGAWWELSNIFTPYEGSVFVGSSLWSYHSLWHTSRIETSIWFRYPINDTHSIPLSLPLREL